MVSIKDTKHKILFGFKELLLLRFTIWSIGGVKTPLHSWDLATMKMFLMRRSKYLSYLREGYAVTFLLIPFLKPISSIAAAEYSVGLDEAMGPEGTGSGP